jgi:hypothetical protein
MPIPGGFIPPIQPDLIHVGRGDLWVNVDVPVAPSVAPVALVNGAPATGTYVGATLAAALLNYNPGIFDIVTQQATGVVGTVITAEEFSIEFTAGELTYANLKNFILGAGDGTTYVTVGGFIVPTITSLLMVAPRRAGNYITVFIYKAAFIDNRQFSFNRTGQLEFRIRARAQADPARYLGANLGYFHPNQSST